MKPTDLLNPRYVWERRARIGSKLFDLGRQSARRLGIPTSESDRKIKAVRGIHTGSRAFILGNGPSLRIADLDRLQGELTFASNKIYLAFDQTAWRPTYYFVFDRLVAKNNAEVIQRLPLTKFFSDDVRHLLGGARDAVWLHELWRNEVVQHRADGRPTECAGYFSEDALYGVDAGWTVIYSQLQIAFHMGITEVYLLGVDFSFDVPAKTVSTNERGYGTALESKGEVNHFHPDYRKPGEIWAVPRLDCQKLTFELARQHYEQAGRKIFNASRQTKLEVFPRADFDRVLPVSAAVP